MKKKFPYMKGSRRQGAKSVYLCVGNRVLRIPKENVLLKTLELETALWEIAESQEEARKITELLNKSV